AGVVFLILVDVLPNRDAVIGGRGRRRRHGLGRLYLRDLCLRLLGLRRLGVFWLRVFFGLDVLPGSPRLRGRRLRSLVFAWIGRCIRIGLGRGGLFVRGLGLLLRGRRVDPIQQDLERRIGGSQVLAHRRHDVAQLLAVEENLRGLVRAFP